MIKLVMPLELMTIHTLTFQLSGTLVSGCVCMHCHNLCSEQWRIQQLPSAICILASAIAGQLLAECHIAQQKYAALLGTGLSHNGFC